MKSLHRVKAIESYNGARLMLKQNMPYPAYVLIKESARAVLCYIAEDIRDTDIAEKIKLSKALDIVDHLIEKEDKEELEKLIKLEKQNLGVLLGMKVEDLVGIKKVVKKLIGVYLDERL